MAVICLPAAAAWLDRQEGDRERERERAGEEEETSRRSYNGGFAIKVLQCSPPLPGFTPIKLLGQKSSSNKRVIGGGETQSPVQSIYWRHFVSTQISRLNKIIFEQLPFLFARLMSG